MLGLWFVIGGLVVGLICFGLALRNMLNADLDNIGSVFSSHIGYMVGMVIGGASVFLGIVLLIINFLQKL